MDLPLAKAEPISNADGASVITYLRKGKNKNKNKTLHSSSWESNNPADTKVSEEGGGEGPPGARAEIPLQLVVKTMVRQAVPLQPMEEHGGADIHLQPVEDPMPEQIAHIQDSLAPIHELIHQLESQGVISKTRSPLNSPIWPVQKSDGEWRLTIDYHGLN
ncbi:hypothetical protein QYF61_001101 [Mycteria americana]|uniref:Uncharacterized protein n=1 Tax=Mycteria americana TaxID=33587 RepID=A0AAN7RS96_MYCAM|nr:hypothetical protein QYF61_001101 [Mycteria americana]